MFNLPYIVQIRIFKVNFAMFASTEDNKFFYKRSHSFYFANRQNS